MRLVGESLERRAYIYEARLASPLGIKLAEEAPVGGGYNYGLSEEARRAGSRVVVAGVERGSTAWAAGVRAGDCIVATGAAWGGGMFPTSTVDGVTAAVTSRVQMFGDVNLRFERPFDSADEVSWRSVVAETFVVELAKPLGMELAEKGEGADRAVFVKAVDPAGNAAKAGQVKAGDRIVAVSASVGTWMWAARSVEGVVSAVSTRQLNQPIRFKLERQVPVGAWRELDGRDGSDEGDGDGDGDGDEEGDDEAAEDARRGEAAAGAAGGANEAAEAAPPPPNDKKREGLGLESAAAALESLRGMDVSSASTQAVLFERCCALLHKYGSSSGDDARASAGHVQAVAAAVLAAQVVPPPKVVNMGMLAFLKLRRPTEAVAFFDACVQRGSAPNLLVATTLAKALTHKPTFDFDASSKAPPGPRASAATAAAPLPLRRGTKGPALPSPVPRLAVALAALEKQRLPLDTQFLNQLMKCYLSRGHLPEVSRFGGTLRRPS
jgi:hypothetical protein